MSLRLVRRSNVTLIESRCFQHRNKTYQLSLWDVSAMWSPHSPAVDVSGHVTHRRAMSTNFQMEMDTTHEKMVWEKINRNSTATKIQSLETTSV